MSLLPRHPSRCRATPETSPTLADVAERWVKFVIARTSRWLRARLENYRHCRECGAEAKFTDDVCAGCGASSPVRVPRAIPAAVGAAALLVLLVVWCCS